MVEVQHNSTLIIKNENGLEFIIQIFIHLKEIYIKSDVWNLPNKMKD